MSDLLSELCIFFRDLADGNIQPSIGFSPDAAMSLAQYYTNLRTANEENQIGQDITFRQIISKFNLPFPDDFLDLLREAEQIAGPQELRKKSQRDHYAHTLHAFSLGVYVFHKAERLQRLLVDDGVIDWSQWAFCALLHDIGYITENAGLKQQAVLSKFEELILKPRSILAFVHDNNSGLRIEHLPPTVENDLKLFGNHMREQFSRKFWLSRAGSMSGDYYQFENYMTVPIDTFEGGDHGVKSHFILQLCREICDEFMNYFKIHKGNISSYFYPRNNPWPRYSNAMQAIQSHCIPFDKHTHLNSGNYILNPWINSLHLIDELQDYNRPFLLPSINTNTSKPLRIDEVDFSIVDSILYFHYPFCNATRINGALGSIATDSGICVQAKRETLVVQKKIIPMPQTSSPLGLPVVKNYQNIIQKIISRFFR